MTIVISCRIELLIITLLILAAIHIFAFCVSTHLLWITRKYCQHCDWWSDFGAIILCIVKAIPLIGTFASVANCIDCTRNIVEELTKDKQNNLL